MKRLNPKIRLRVVLSVVALALFWQEPGYCLEQMEIFAWVAGRMDIADSGSLPEIHYVDKAELQAAFTRANRNSYLRWESRFGPHEAERILNTYLQELAGIYDPDSKTIYLGRFLAPCDQEAILAHELTHYLQVRQDGKVEQGRHDTENIQLKREMQAGAIEQRYRENFCKDEHLSKTKATP